MTLWEGKWLILGATLLAAVLGFEYITLTPNKFEARLILRLYQLTTLMTIPHSMQLMPLILKAQQKLEVLFPSIIQVDSPFSKLPGYILQTHFTSSLRMIP